MTSKHDQAREALAAQGFTRPGPKLIELVVAAMAREKEGPPAGVRRHGFDPGELLADTPELLDRTTGPMTNPGTEMSFAAADVITNAMAHLSGDDDEESDS
jgi:hypothetical protein